MGNVAEFGNIFEPARSGDLSIRFVGWLEHDHIPQPYIQFSPDGQWMLTNTSRNAYIWDYAALTPKQQIEWGMNGTFSGDSRHAVVWMRGWFTVVEVESGRQVLELTEPGPAHGPRYFRDRPSRVTIHQLSFSQLAPRLFIGLSAQYKRPRPPDDRKDFYYGSRNQCLVRHGSDGSLIREFLDCNSMALTLDTRFWMIGSKHGMAIYDTASFEVVHRLDPPRRGRYQFSRDNTVLSCVAGDERKWVLTEFPTGAPIATHDIPDQGTPTKPKLLTYVLPNTIWAYDVEKGVLTDGVSGNVVQDLNDFPPRQYPSISSSGRLLGGTAGQTLYLRDLATGDELRLTDEKFDDLNHVMFSPRGERLFVFPAKPFRVTTLAYRRDRSEFANRTLVFEI
jgi:hypothetical protein